MKQKPKTQAFVNINFHNFKCSFTAFSIFFFSHSPLFLFFLPVPCSFSPSVLNRVFSKASSFDFAKRERGYVSTEARNLWKAKCPGGHPAAKQKHKKGG